MGALLSLIRQFLYPARHSVREKAFYGKRLLDPPNFGKETKDCSGFLHEASHGPLEKKAYLLSTITAADVETTIEVDRHSRLVGF